MKKVLLVLVCVFLAAIFVFQFKLQTVEAQGDVETEKFSQLKAIHVFGEKSGIAYTKVELWQTDNNGESWRKIKLPRNVFQTISTAYFLDEMQGAVILTDGKSLELVKTNNGGQTWDKNSIAVRQEDLSEADLENAVLEYTDQYNLLIRLRLPTSSNFTGEILYRTRDGGMTWEFIDRSISKRDSDVETEKTSRWTLKFEGNCEGYKIGCFNETKIFFGTKEITPPEIKELNRLKKENAKTQAQNTMSAPGGSTRISMNRGFDKCTAAPVNQMQIWWDTSPFYDSNIYISGRNRGCSQPQLTRAWVEQVSGMGWGLIPTIVGYQAPCSVCTNCQKHSTDPAEAETQGRGEADISIADANNLGLTQGTVLYYDMERYDNPSGTTACGMAVRSFLKGWTDRLHEQGYISGVYGSPTNAVGDWIHIPAASRMDAVWLARWDNVPSVWYYAPPSPPIPDGFWMNHQRIKQWQAPHNETWGGVTFNIDGNIADGPVAGVRAARNKPADFDGDGKSDISVFRPESGVWYWLGSTNNSFGALNFGLSSDIIAPGDYDGDGRTDFAVFRPETGVWYEYSYNPARANATVFRNRQFGASGDIPVASDYDGDGITDLAVFRGGVWYITNSFDPRNPNLRVEQFGMSGDLPVLGDYDGDGRSDLAVYRPSNGTWNLMRSSQGFTGISFGISSDKPVPADYDGDGKTDVAVYRDGIWYLLRSQQGFTAIQFGAATDVPLIGDYDGDNKADFAVFRPSNGVWYVWQTQSGFNFVQFGNGTDKPVPGAYLPQN
ncbi:MAG: glycoside hydrolase domain-containing protein [Pyrinomonadaceae bacterium]